MWLFQETDDQALDCRGTPLVIGVIKMASGVTLLKNGGSPQFHTWRSMSWSMKPMIRVFPIWICSKHCISSKSHRFSFSWFHFLNYNFWVPFLCKPIVGGNHKPWVLAAIGSEPRQRPFLGAFMGGFFRSLNRDTTWKRWRGGLLWDRDGSPTFGALPAGSSLIPQYGAGWFVDPQILTPPDIFSQTYYCNLHCLIKFVSCLAFDACSSSRFWSYLLYLVWHVDFGGCIPTSPGGFQAGPQLPVESEAWRQWSVQLNLNEEI